MYLALEASTTGRTDLTFHVPLRSSVSFLSLSRFPGY